MMDPDARECGWMGCGRDQCLVRCNPSTPLPLHRRAAAADSPSLAAPEYRYSPYAHRREESA